MYLLPYRRWFCLTIQKLYIILKLNKIKKLIYFFICKNHTIYGMEMKIGAGSSVFIFSIQEKKKRRD